MKYTLFFFILTLYLSYLMITWDSKYSAFLLWPMVSLVFMGTVYLLNKPEMLGKNSKGTIQPVVLILNLPWFILQYLIWHIQYLISKENTFDKIDGLNIYIGRRPRNIKDLPEVDVVIDLTSEFVENRKVSAKSGLFEHLILLCPNGFFFNYLLAV